MSCDMMAALVLRFSGFAVSKGYQKLQMGKS